MMKSLVRKIDILKYAIITTGHGEGGVYAIIGAFRISRILNTRLISVFTFGQPRMGELPLSRFLNDWIAIYRITYQDDFIPQMPPRSEDLKGYFHSAYEYWIEQDCECSDPSISKNSDINSVHFNLYACKEFWNEYLQRFEEPKTRATLWSIFRLFNGDMLMPQEPEYGTPLTLIWLILFDRVA
ncbi:hypothetical protein G9A89_007418 [Geosiphon pyriformis]|nr:hypothetical protein G9A89_007418 [Geosiphon pyriformis]